MRRRHGNPPTLTITSDNRQRKTAAAEAALSGNDCEPQLSYCRKAFRLLRTAKGFPVNQLAQMHRK